MSIVLKTFFPFFTILSFYTKHMFKFIYVNQLIHMVILVDNVDKFVHNLIIGGFADFCHVENFLQSFHLSTMVRQVLCILPERPFQG